MSSRQRSLTRSGFTGPMTVKAAPKREEKKKVQPETVKVYQPPTETKSSPVVPAAPMTQADPMTSAVSNMWANVNPAIGQQYNQNLMGMLDGSTFDPMAAQSKEALARHEANQRASTADGIADTGFAGTPMGALTGQGTEDQLARNRFDNNVNIEANRQLVKQKGMAEARGYANDSNAYEEGQSGRIGEAGTAFSSYAQTHLDLKDMSPDELMADQGFASNAQSLWEAYGGTGKVPSQWAKYQLDAVNDPRLNDATTATHYQIDQLLEQGIYNDEEAQMLKDFASQGVLQFIKRDPENPKRVLFDSAAIEKFTGTGLSSYDPTTDSPWSPDADKIVKEGKSDDPAYGRVVKARAQEVIDGNRAAASVIDSSLGKDDPVYKQLLSMNAGLSGYGDVGEVNPPGWGNDRHSYTNLEQAYADNSLVRKDGELWEVSGRRVREKGWKNWTVYTLKNPATDETKIVTAKG